MQHVDFVKKMLDSMAFIDTIERMNKQQIESKIDEGQELTPAELRSLFASALAETAALLPARHKLAGWIDTISRTLSSRDFFEPLRTALLSSTHTPAIAAALATRTQQLDQLRQHAAPPPPPAIPAAQAGINLAPRLLPVPRAALAG